jgi:hypothetical protein
MEYRSTRPSRRRFLSTTLAAAAALLKAASAKPAFARRSDPERERLTRLLAKYGSELGDLRRVEGGN